MDKKKNIIITAQNNPNSVAQIYFTALIACQCHNRASDDDDHHDAE